ncbi:MAG: hypothetical protein ACO2OX_00150 [Candidatus Nanopusillus sp.]|jgi:hypothetical protein
MHPDKDKLTAYLNTFYSILKKYVDLYYKDYSKFLSDYVNKVGIIDLYERFLIYLASKKKIDISNYTITRRNTKDNLELLDFDNKIIGEIYLFVKDILIKYFQELNRSPAWGNINIKFPPEN